MPLAGLLLALFGAAAAADNAGKVHIEGGADLSGHNYQWTVANRHDLPIVSLEFPHFRADLFLVPDGWSTDGSTYPEGKPGLCVATAVRPSQGIQPGGSEVFGMRIRPKGAFRGSATVRIGFADGSAVSVADVALPQPEPAAGKYTRLIGYGVLGVLFLIVIALRARKRPPGNAPQ